MRSFVVFLSMATVTYAATSSIQRCMEGSKTCMGVPNNCVGSQCDFGFSYKPNDSHVEIEIFAQKVSTDMQYVAVGYSTDTKMGDDVVVFCLRNDKQPMTMKKAGLSHNVDTPSKNSEVVGTIDELPAIEDGSDYELQIVEYSSNQNQLYCKLTHRIDPLVQRLNSSVVQILMAQGTSMSSRPLSYHGSSRFLLGEYELKNKKKSKKVNGVSSWSAFSAAVVVVLANAF